MPRHDFHLHTRFSVDGQAGPRDMCLQALTVGSDAHRADRCCPDRPEVWDRALYDHD